jgi:hypothetical protein
LNGRLGGFQSPFGQFGKEKNLTSLLGQEPRNVHKAGTGIKVTEIV